jgi:hypothetical protein
MPETMKLLEENIWRKFPGLGNNFLNMTEKAEAPKVTIDQWHHIKLKASFSIAKEAIGRRKGQPWKGGSVY